MEKELYEYLQNLKESNIDTREIKKGILRIKKYLDDVFDCLKLDLEDGDITKKEIVDDFLEIYRKESKEASSFDTRIFFLFSQYDGCKKILKAARKNNNGDLNCLINQAKRDENENSKEMIYNKVNINEEINMILRLAIRSTRNEKKAKGKKDSNDATFQEIMEKVHFLKESASKEIKKELISSIQQRVYFLNEYGYIDEYIAENNESLKAAGLEGIALVKRNPFPDKEYDKYGNIVNTEEFEDMGVIDFFDEEHLDKLSPEELFALELFWKSKYHVENLEIAEAISAIELLDLWPTIMEKDEKALDDIDEEKLKLVPKRDLAFSYLLQNKAQLTPELEDRYIKFLEKNNLKQEGTTKEEIMNLSDSLENVFNIANSLLLQQCILFDKLINKEIEVKDWGIVENSEFEDLDNNDRLIIAVEMDAFRGTLLLAMKSKDFYKFLGEQRPKEKPENLKLKKYKGVLDSNYSKAMATLLLPTSVYFKKYVNEKYKENPSSSLYKQLAVNFAGGKKIKEKERDEI